MIPNVAIVFLLNGKRLSLAFRKVPFSAWTELKHQLGFTPKTIIVALEDADVEAVAALIWLERKQRERRLTWAEVRKEMETADEMEFEVVDFLQDGASLLGEDAPAPEDDADPTTAGD